MSSSSAILRTVPLPRSGPFPTLDPFLFCAYHVDEYPEDPSGGKMEFFTRGNGSDFDPSAPYRMYHGDYVPGFPQHPHRGFETITATIRGKIDHADSVGNAGRYGDGDVQWMTAGKGIVHGEMFPLVNNDKPNTLQAYQIWLNLPSAKKMVDPSFSMFWHSDIPVWNSEDQLSSVTVWAGNYFLDETKNQNQPPPDSWASDSDNDVAVLRIVIKPGGKLVIPKANKATEDNSDGDGVKVNRSLYFVENGFGDEIQIDGKTIKEKVCITLDATKDVTIEFKHASYCNTKIPTVEFLLLQGKPIDEPVVSHGPFVMNTQQEIRQTFIDYQKTKFGGWPWKRNDMVFPQNTDRFALIDGKEIFPRPSASSDNTNVCSKENGHNNDDEVLSL